MLNSYSNLQPVLLSSVPYLKFIADCIRKWDRSVWTVIYLFIITNFMVQRKN